MDLAAASLVLATVFAWGVFSSSAARVGLSAPMVFVAAGFVYAEGLGVLELDAEPELVKIIVEVTLVWILFADAAQVGLSKFRRDLGLYGRLLGVGLPLTMAFGTFLAVVLLGLDAWSALLLGAALAPTDAALGAAVMSDPRVPARIRRVLNVESGLNDGIATPVVLLAIAGVATEKGIAGVHEPRSAIVALVVGLLVGAAVGGIGGTLVRLSRRHRWLSEGLAGPAVLALALFAYTCAGLIEANGFVAAFIGGLAFGATVERGGPRGVAFVEESGGLASMISWLMFGALALPAIGELLDWRIIGYAVLSLTVVRMVPVAVALIGTGLDRASVAFIGWFGPRGLASVIFALLALEDLDGAAAEVVAGIGATVVISVVAHGFSTRPLAGMLSRRSEQATHAAPSGRTVSRPPEQGQPPRS